MSDTRVEIVRRGYNEAADRFVAWAERVEGDPRLRLLEQLSLRLHEGARVLELGCGGGVESTRRLAERFHVTAVDISESQLALARARVPAAQYIHADLLEIELEPDAFEAVVAFYVLNHVPRELLGGLVARIASWLVPGGHLLACLGVGDTAEWIGEWSGTETSMFFSSWDDKTNRRLLEEAGFELLLDELVAIREPDGGATFQWVLAVRR